MKARVARFEGGDAAEVERVIGEIKQRAESGPPEGVPAVGFLVLHNASNVLAISLFESEDDLRQGDETLNAMDPPVPGGMGRRVSVDSYDVGIKIDR
jgi:hypothetical protein